MKSILDRSFKYVPAAQTDVAKTFKRIIAQQKAEAEALKALSKVTQMRKAAK